MHLVAPQRLACADVTRYLRDEKRLAYFRRTSEKVRARVQQTVYYRRPAFVHVVKELIQRYSMQIIRVVHLSHLPEESVKVFVAFCARVWYIVVVLI